MVCGCQAILLNEDVMMLSAKDSVIIYQPLRWALARDVMQVGCCSTS